MNTIKFFITFIIGSAVGLAAGMLVMKTSDNQNISLAETHSNFISDKAPLTNLSTNKGNTLPIQKINTEKPKDTVTAKKVITFVDNANIPLVDNFDELMQSIDSETELLYKKLNTDYYGLFQFNNKKEYQRLLDSGMPTPEELSYIYQTDINEISDYLRKLLSTANSSNTNLIKKEKLASIALNRAVDELIAQMKNYQADYQFGDPILVMGAEYVTDNPSDIMRAIKNVNIMTVHAHGDLATTQLARIRYIELNISQYDTNHTQYEIIAHIAKAESTLFTQNISKAYGDRHQWNDELKAIYSSIKVAL